jgi:transglutaminase-like putative cysteine protease
MVRLIGVLTALSILVSNTALVKLTDKTGEFDDSNVNKGTVGARYVPKVETRTKTRVQNSKDKYDYDLFGREDFEYFPLQMGNGEYKIAIFENVSDNRYRQVKQKNIKADIKDDLSVYTASIQNIRWDRDMAVIKKADELCKNLKTDMQKIEAIYNYVVSTLSYDYEKIKKIENTYVPDIEQVVKDKKGICYDYSALFAAMLRSQNIPTKLMKGYSDNVKEYHAWNEVYIASEKRWMVVDTTYDSVMKQNKKPYKMEKDKAQYKANREY